MKPLNIEHAKAGAPVRLSDGTETVRVIATDVRGSYPVVALIALSTIDRVQCFNEAGEPQSDYGWKAGVKLVMTPIATVEGRDVYMGDTLLSLPSRNEYVVSTAVLPPINFTWPRKYPQTQMDDDELISAFCLVEDAFSTVDGYRAVANAAIAHGVKHGYLIEPVYLANDHELMAAFYHPAPSMPMMPHSYERMVEQLRRVRDTVFTVTRKH